MKCLCYYGTERVLNFFSGMKLKSGIEQLCIYSLGIKFGGVTFFRAFSLLYVEESVDSLYGIWSIFLAHY